MPGKKELNFKKGIKSENLAMGGENAIFHNNAQAGQMLSHVEMPTSIGRNKSNVIINMDEAPEAKNAGVGMQNFVAVNFANVGQAVSDEHRAFRNRVQQEGENVRVFANPQSSLHPTSNQYWEWTSVKVRLKLEGKIQRRRMSVIKWLTVQTGLLKMVL